MPILFKQYSETCRLLHNGWDHKLWTNENIHELNYDKKVFDTLTGFDLKKDYLMLLALKQHGGVFLDADSVCLRPFDDLHHKYDFIASMHHPAFWLRIPTTITCIMFSRPNHPVLDLMLNAIARYATDDNYRRAFNADTTIHVDREVMHSSIQYSVGISLNKWCEGNPCDRVMVFPPTYFIPVIYFTALTAHGKYYSFMDKVRILLNLQKDPVQYNWIPEHAISVNDFWAKEFLNPYLYFWARNAHRQK